MIKVIVSSKELGSADFVFCHMASGQSCGLGDRPPGSPPHLRLHNRGLLLWCPPPTTGGGQNGALGGGCSVGPIVSVKAAKQPPGRGECVRRAQENQQEQGIFQVEDFELT